MKHKLLNQSLIAFIATGAIALANISARAADLAGNVQGAGQPIAGSTVTLYAAGTGAPTQLAQWLKSKERGQPFIIDISGWGIAERKRERRGWNSKERIIMWCEEAGVRRS